MINSLLGFLLIRCPKISDNVCIILHFNKERIYCIYILIIELLTFFIFSMSFYDQMMFACSYMGLTKVSLILS